MQIKHLISLSSLLLSVDKIAFEIEKEKEMKENYSPSPGFSLSKDEFKGAILGL